MPYRKVPFVNGEIYHVFNRSVARQPIFETHKSCRRALETINYYQYSKTPISFSHYRRLSPEIRQMLDETMQHQGKKVILLGFCLMPNHFHFLIQQTEENGISEFLGNFQNSFAKYFNTTFERTGAVFQAMFKAVRIESNDQLLHVARYIHLNPLTAYILRDNKDLDNYPWSSFKEYLNNKETLLTTVNLILEYFPSVQAFKEFTLNQSEYQRVLKDIRHLTLE